MPTIWFTTLEWWRLSHDMRALLRKLVRSGPQDIPDHRKRQTADALVRRGYAMRLGNSTIYKVKRKGRDVFLAEERAQGRASEIMGVIQENARRAS